MRGGNPGSPGNLALVGPLRAAVSHVEVDNILSVSPLHRNSKGLKGMKGKGNETSHGVADGAAQEASLDLKLEQTRVAGIEPKQNEREKEREAGRDTHHHLESAQRGNVATHSFSLYSSNPFLCQPQGIRTAKSPSSYQLVSGAGL